MDAGVVTLHIGLHKTGSSSIQAFLGDNRELLLQRHGIAFFDGAMRDANNHVELHLYAMRSDRSSPARSKFGLTAKSPFIQQATARVRAFAATHQRSLFSAEGLSYLRFGDEMATLRELFPNRKLELIAYVRETAAFTRSYRTQLQRMGIPESDDPDSFAYIGPDSWLLHYGERLATYARSFDRVSTINYDLAISASGNVIPSFLSALGVGDDPHLTQKIGYFNNVTPD